MKRVREQSAAIERIYGKKRVIREGVQETTPAPASSEEEVVVGTLRESGR